MEQIGKHAGNLKKQVIMKKTIYYILVLLLLPSLSFSQVIISGNGEISASGDANIILSGDWSNNATNTGFTASTGTGVVYFHSTNAQSIGGNKKTSFDNLTVQNSNTASLTVDAPIEISGILDFELKGIVHVGTGSITFLGDASTSNPTTKKFIDGPATYIGNQSFTFDIGDGTKYAPVRIADPGSSAMTVTAQYYYSKNAQNFPPNSTSISAPLVKVSDVEYWHITSTSSISEEVRIFWKDPSESFILDPNDPSLRFAKYDGSNWVDEPASKSVSSGKGYLTSTAALPLSDLYVTFGTTDNVKNPLPIQLLSFTAQCQKQDVVIEWSTASEDNNNYFTLLRSKDAEHYEEIAQISGAGNSNEVLNYSYQDWNAASGNFYYMLKQTDFNGKSESFEPIFVNCDYSKEVSLKMLYDGNQPYALLSNAQSGSQFHVMIVDYTARVVVEKTQAVNAQNYYRIPSEQLAAGIYSIIYYNDNGSVRLSEKFLIK